MSRMSNLFFCSMAGLVLFLSIPAPAKADSFTPVFIDTIPLSGGVTQFNYNLQYNATGGALQSGDFVTIYDIPGFQAAAILGGTGVVFNADIPLIGLTPPGLSPTDNPSLPNVVFQYTGPTITTSQTFTGFVIESTFGFTQTGAFADQTHGATGAPVGELGSVKTPGGVSSVPEPATMVLLGSGLAGIVLKVRKRLKTI